MSCVNSLIRRVKEEYEGDHAMRCCLVFSLQKLLYANSLACKEDEHAAGGHHEEETTAELVTHESSQNCPEKVPYGEDAINEQLQF
jgi:hypothetical protein